MQKTVEAWWFSNDKILPHGDGRRIRKGITHKIKGEVVPCKNGLHGSKKILDALTYAPGSIIWKVQLSGVVVAHNNDKLAASERTYLTNGNFLESAPLMLSTFGTLLILSFNTLKPVMKI